MFQRKNFAHKWEGMIEPFKIIGNVYFIGTFPASSHLIDTGEGLILIDPGYSETLHLVVDSIHRLGFDTRDIKYIINTHWHGDHTEATAALAYLCKAQTLIGKEDAEKCLKYFTPDVLIKDGDTLALGNTVIEFLETPGHTKGTISFFFETEEIDKKYRVGMFGGAGANTMVREKLDFPEAREAYRDSLHRLHQEKVDVMLGNHVWNNNTEEYGKIILESGENKFINDKLWNEFLDFCEKRLDKIIAEGR